ncbi:MAG: ATP-dependent sacrificial sulfur transferase LarE [Caldilineaceae bacterium]
MQPTCQSTKPNLPISQSPNLFSPETAAKPTRSAPSSAASTSVLVAYSGGVDSVGDGRGPRAIRATVPWPASASRPATPRGMRGHQAGVKDLDIPFRTVDTEEYLDPNYAANPTNRCYFCKSELHDQLKTIVREEGWHWVLDGANASDLGDHRPGMDAARERNVRSPLLEVGITKADVREIARHLGLPVWDKPAMACLSSRVPHGTPITPELLRQIEAAEDVLVDLGFPNSGCVTTARSRIETSPWTTSTALDQHIANGVKAAGYCFVTLDLAGFRSGSLNGASNGAGNGAVIPLEVLL